MHLSLGYLFIWRIVVSINRKWLNHFPPDANNLFRENSKRQVYIYLITTLAAFYVTNHSVLL